MNKIEFSKEVKKMAIQDIKQYFAHEREEEIGDLGSELILDFIISKIGPYIYNQAINDSQTYMSEKVEEFYALMI
jgi:uncharacterized protein (DUF2164 family)